MSTYRGNTSFRTIDEVEVEDRNGLDQLRVVRRGKRSDLATEKANWTRGVSGTSLGYPNMYLRTKQSRDSGNYGVVELSFQGFLSSVRDNPTSISDDISMASGSYTPSEPDDNGNEITVQAKYYAQSSTKRWIHYGTEAPRTPQYPSVVPSDVNTLALFDHYPASYNGTLSLKYVGRLSQFSREELCTGVWAVVETWTNRIEPGG